MKDVPHHMKKLNRLVVRSVHHEEMQDADYEKKMPDLPHWKHSKSQMKKQAKEKVRKERLERTPIHKTEEERNWEMQHRTPLYDPMSQPRNKGIHPIPKKNPRVRSVHYKGMQDASYEKKMPDLPNWKSTKFQIKKQAKAKIRKERLKRSPSTRQRKKETGK